MLVYLLAARRVSQDDFYQQIETVLQEKGFAMEENFIDRWISKGEIIGVQIGLQQAFNRALERQAALTLRQLRRRIGEIPPDLQGRVRKLQLERLEQLGEDLLDFNELADLQAWLEHNALGLER